MRLECTERRSFHSPRIEQSALRERHVAITDRFGFQAKGTDVSRLGLCKLEVKYAYACRSVNDFVVTKRELETAEGCASKNSYQSMVRNFIEWDVAKGLLQSSEIHRRRDNFHAFTSCISKYLYRALGCFISFVKKRNVGVYFLPLCRPRLLVGETARVKDCETRQYRLRPSSGVAPSPINHRSDPMWIDRMICPIAMQWAEEA